MKWPGVHPLALLHQSSMFLHFVSVRPACENRSVRRTEGMLLLRPHQTSAVHKPSVAEDLKVSVMSCVGERHQLVRAVCRCQLVRAARCMFVCVCVFVCWRELVCKCVYAICLRVCVCVCAPLVASVFVSARVCVCVP